MAEAERETYLTSYEALRRLARDIVQDEHEAADVVQEVWLASEEAGEGVRRRAPWLRAVTRHIALRKKARRARRRGMPELDGPTEPEVDAGEHAARAEQRELLRGMVRDLDEPYRTVVRGRYLEGRSFDELAATLGRSPATVRSQVRRGLALLRESFDRRHGGDRALWSATLLHAFALDRDGDAMAASAGGTILATVADPRVWGTAALVAIGALGWLARSAPDDGTDRTEALARAEIAGTTRPGARDLPGAAATPEAARDAIPTTPDDPTRGAAPATLPGIDLRVVDETGAPVEGASVHLGRPRGAAALAGATDTEGRFELRAPGEDADAQADRHFGNYAVGERFLTVGKAGMQSSPTYYFDRARAAGQSLEIRLVRGDARLRGRVVDGSGVGVEGVRVGLDGGMQRAPRVEGAFRVLPFSTRTTSTADGSFEIRGLAPTAQSLLADHPDHVPWSGSVPAEDWVGDEVEVVLERGVVLRGTVQDESLAPVAGAVVRLWSWSEVAPRAAATASDGSFALPGLPRGRARFFASSGADPADHAVASTVLDLRDDQDASWTATLLRSGDVRFELVDEGGAPLAGWRLQVATAARDWYAAVSTGADGVTGPLGDWPREPLVLHVFRAGPDQVFPVHAIEAWTPAAGTARIVVEDARGEPGEIRGTVRAAGGELFAGVQVYLSSLATGMVTRSDVSATTGDFEVRNLPAGEYLVIANAPTGKADLARVSLLPGERRDVGVLRAPEIGWLTVELGGSADDGSTSYRLFTDWPDLHGTKAQATIGGRGVPTRKALLAGTYEVEVSMGARTARERFEVRPGEEVVVELGAPGDAISTPPPDRRGR